MLGRVTIERTNPPALHATPGYHHVTKIRADELVMLAGQCPLEPSGDLAKGGLSGQTEQVIQNILLALEAAGAGPADVVRTEESGSKRPAGIASMFGTLRRGPWC